MKKIVIVLVIMAFAAPAYSLTGISFGIKGGVTMNTDLGTAESIADIDGMTLIGGQLKISTLPVVDFIGTVEYAWSSVDIPSTDMKFKFHDLALTGSVVYPFNFQVVKPYAGFGIGTHILGYSLEGGGVTLPIPSDKSFFGYHLLGGFDIGFVAIPFSITGEARINWIKTDDELTKYFQLTAGINFSFL